MASDGAWLQSSRSSSGENRLELIALGEQKASDRAMRGHESSGKMARLMGP